jgi:hypothetical protein
MLVYRSNRDVMVFGFFGGKRVDISIQLDRPDGVYAVGDTVGAQIALAAENAGRVREVRAGLVLQHRYQIIDRTRDSDGDYSDTHQWRARETWVGRELLATEGARSANGTQSVAWQIPPDAAASCDGDIVKVAWVVKVTVDRAMARDQNEEVPLRVVTPRPGQYTQSSDFGEMNTGSGVAMRFSLPSLELIEGETLQGRLTVEPSQSIDAREIRVELVRSERVNPGNRAHVKQKAIQKIQVAGSTKPVPGQPVAYDFALPVPAVGSPGHDVGDTSVTWQLVGIIDRPMRGVYTVTQWVGIYNG